jgi:hypothetical protein
MHFILKAHHSDHGSDAQSEYAYVDLTPQYAQLLLERRTAFQSVKQLGDRLYRLTYWEACDWLGGPAYLRHHLAYPASWHVEDYGDPTEAFLRQYLTEDALKNLNHGYGPQRLPATFALPERLLDRTECEMMDVTDDGVLFKSYPRHSDCQQETDAISWELILQAANATDADRPEPADASPLPAAASASGASPASAPPSGASSPHLQRPLVCFTHARSSGNSLTHTAAVRALLFSACPYPTATYGSPYEQLSVF